MKVLGFSMIIISGIICAVYFSESRRERIKELDSICFMLEFIQAELVCKMSPLPLIFTKLANAAKDKSADFAKVMGASFDKLGAEDFSSIWQSCCEKSFLHLKEKEFESMTRLAAVLGKYDVDTQISAINDCLCCIRSSYSSDTSRFPEFKRLSIGVSVSLASLIAIMMF